MNINEEEIERGAKMNINKEEIERAVNLIYGLFSSPTQSHTNKHEALVKILMLLYEKGFALGYREGKNNPLSGVSIEKGKQLFIDTARIFYHNALAANFCESLEKILHEIYMVGYTDGKVETLRQVDEKQDENQS